MLSMILAAAAFNMFVMNALLNVKNGSHRRFRGRAHR